MMNEVLAEISNIEIPTVSSDGRGFSLFSSRVVELQGDQQRMLSEQISAVNFRLRSSDASYASGWHVAGDPTLLVILGGTVQLILRNGETREFSAGEMFVAEDYLKDDIEFDPEVHGHRAKVIGGQPISVLHLKLEKRS